MKVCFLLRLFFCTILIWTQNSHAMDVPDPFPGHTSRQIVNLVVIPDEFDPSAYQQNKLNKEGACQFNALVAILMNTAYGRTMMQKLLVSQTDQHVNIKFHFPNAEQIDHYNGVYIEHVKGLKQNNQAFEQEIKNTTDEDTINQYKNTINETNEEILNMEGLWQRVRSLSNTCIKVPKKFVTREEGGSFPHDNPEWLNLVQQAYMRVTKISLLRLMANSGYAVSEEFPASDRFASVPKCYFNQGNYPPDQPTPTYLNCIPDPSRKELYLFPLVDIPLKNLKLSLKGNEGLNLSEINDIQAVRQADGSFVYHPLTYTTEADFANRHGLTKALLVASNGVQFDSAGHGVCLLFGNGKVHYYDNVKYDHPKQKEVYGEIGPIYQEGKFFQGQAIENMSEEEFFTRFFKEINYRIQQVAKVRDQTQPQLSTEIYFFEKSLVAQ